VTAQALFAVDDEVDVFFHPIFLAVENAPVQPFFGGHLLQGDFLGVGFGVRSVAGVFEVFDQALQGVGPAVEDEVFGEFPSLGGIRGRG